ncbi:MAG: hypothetical protein K2P58_02730 [Hyphomonadaceae bacterium]|nr:hypothetical protein [Hyphomonadaceae bacterium]
MRIAAPAFAAAIVFSSAAWADPVTLAPISFSAEMQTSIEEELGQREAETLRATVHDAVASALSRHGATLAQNGAITVEIEVLDADPNRPTMQQLAATPGLDAIRSVYRGGAELRAVLRTSDGRTVEVHQEYYDPTIEQASWRAGTWSTARIAIRRFATKVADAYDDLS